VKRHVKRWRGGQMVVRWLIRSDAVRLSLGQRNVGQTIGTSRFRSSNSGSTPP
jgi:hypothetical protein